jgi:uncharacterized membrane protein
MNLPPINLPKIPIPFEVPQMMHPCIIHFAIALPVVILFLEIINLIVKKRTIGVLSFLLALLASTAAIAAYMTGNVDANLANMDTVIQTHKNLGAYVVVLSMVVVAFKLFSVMIRTGIVKAIYMMILMVYVGFVANEAMSGKELVYKDGVNISNITKLKTLNKNLNVEINGLKVVNKQKVQQMQDLNMTIKSLQEQLKQQNAKVQSQDNKIKELTAQKSDIIQENKQMIEDINSSVENNQTSELNITEL